MSKIYRSYKRLSVWILLFTQILLILSYFYLKVDDIAVDIEKISFVNQHEENERPKRTYHTVDSKIFLKSVNTRAQFVDFNSSLCYINGTDLVSMKRSKDQNWQCTCLSGWHGIDCGQPEVIWRALLTYRKPLKLSGPRNFERRIIYIFMVDKLSEMIAEIRVNELANIVDLFILYETSSFLADRLNNKFLEKHHEKILYLKEADLDRFPKIIRNLRDDDIVLTTEDNVIVNKFAINFLKYHNKWPEPVYFRLRWSVFGYFWVHPKKTVITGGACSISYFGQVLGNKLKALADNRTGSPQFRGIILGDLNHSGGWYCEYCFDVAQIIEYLTIRGRNDVNLEKISRQKIDSNFLEDVIENGLYIDGKTELVRAHRYRDNYFAPPYVLDNDWKYDFLLKNFYSKLDYYEG